jgi:hypothetical protein
VSQSADNPRSGERASRHLIGFFTATIRNRNTLMAYPRAVKCFFDGCDDHYARAGGHRAHCHRRTYRGARLWNCQAERQTNLAAIRQLFDYLVTGGVLVSSPAGSVRVLFNATIRNWNTRMAYVGR